MEDRSASMLELKALRVPHGHYDVAVLGGGLAGLSMALQLKLARPDTRVLVTDKRNEPAPRLPSRSASRASRSALTTTAK